MNRCARSGYLIDSTLPMPSDATVAHVERLPIVGCTRLRCSRCDADVRNAPGLAFATKDEHSEATLAALYNTPDLATSPLLHKTQPKFRLYLCRCDRWLETSKHPCHDDDRDHLTDPDMAWQCAGHPVIAYPHDVEGEMVGSDNDLQDLATRGFHGFTPPKTPALDAPRGNWVIRLRARLSPEGQKLLDGVALAALQDADAKARGRAIRYFFVHDVEAGAVRAYELLSGDRTLFAGVRDEVTEVFTDKTLEESLWRVAAKLGRLDERVRGALRAEALSGRAGRSVFSAIAKDDSEWLEANIEQLGRMAKGDRFDTLIAAFAQLPPGRDLDGLEALARKGAGN